MGNRVEKRLQKLRIMEKLRNKQTNKQVKLKCHVGHIRLTDVTGIFIRIGTRFDDIEIRDFISFQDLLAWLSLDSHTMLLSRCPEGTPSGRSPYFIILSPWFGLSFNPPAHALPSPGAGILSHFLSSGRPFCFSARLIFAYSTMWAL